MKTISFRHEIMCKVKQEKDGGTVITNAGGAIGGGGGTGGATLSFLSLVGFPSPAGLSSAICKKKNRKKEKNRKIRKKKKLDENCVRSTMHSDRNISFIYIYPFSPFSSLFIFLFYIPQIYPSLFFLFFFYYYFLNYFFPFSSSEDVRGDSFSVFFKQYDS